MTDTINNKIPFVPENTIDPAAGLNLSLNTIDALLQVLVQTVGLNTPPTGVEGQRFIVGTAPTGAWAGQANKLARFLDGAWQFFDARHVLNAADGLIWVRSGSTWVSLGGAPTWGSITGTLSAQTDLQSALDGKVGTGDSRLTDAREWTADTVAQAEAEAGTATNRRAWTAERVRQAIAAWWNGATSAFGRGFVAAADAAAGRTALGLGTAAVASLGSLISSTTTQLFGTSGLERVCIDSSGNLGVGTAFPTGRLSIAGSANDTWATGGLGGLTLNGISGGVSTISTFLDTTSIRIGAGVSQKTGLFINGQNATGGSYVSFSAGGAEMARVDARGLTAPLAAYTLATLPSAAAKPRLQVYCSNLAGQAAPVFSDGTAWRRVSDNTIAN